MIIRVQSLEVDSPFEEPVALEPGFDRSVVSGAIQDQLNLIQDQRSEHQQKTMH
jgi:hypothetical protein